MALHKAVYFKDTMFGRIHYELHSIAGTEFDFNPEFVVEVTRPESLTNVLELPSKVSVLVHLETKDVDHPDGLSHLSSLYYLSLGERELFISGLTEQEFDAVHGE